MQGKVFFQLGVNKVFTQFVYDFTGGGLKNFTTAQFTDMVYNPTDGMIWGHGITVQGKYFVRELSKMNPVTLEVSTVKVLKTLSVDGAALVALDVEKQSMYWISTLFKDAPTPQHMPFYLVQVSLANGSVVSEVRAK